MVIVAIDTATETLAIGAGDAHGRVLANFGVHMPKMHATLLHPLLEDMLAAVRKSMSDVRGIAVGVGPGSYTGVRIGVTAAKTLAYALDIPIAPVSSLAAAGYRARAHHGLVAVVWDARRGQAYYGLYRSEPQSWQALGAETRRPYEEILRDIRSHVELTGLHQVALLGDGAMRLHELAAVEGSMTCSVYDASATVSASEIYLLGIPSIEGGIQHDAHSLVPCYLQLAEAEARWRLAECAPPSHA